MKKEILLLTSFAAIAGVASAADQYWNGVGSTSGWDTTTAEWDSTAGAGVTQTWVNGNDAFIPEAAGAHSISEDITVNNLTYTGTVSTMNFGGGSNTLTINGTLNGVTKGWRFGNTINGTYTLTGARATHTGGDMSGTVTVSSGAQLMMTVGSGLSGNVTLAGGSLLTRWGAGENQSMGVLSGVGSIANNAGSGHTAFDTTLTIGQLSIGTDGTIGTISSSDAGSNDVYVMKLGVGSHQFDLNSSGGTLTNDFFDMAASTNGVDLGGGTIALSATGDALVEGDSFQLLSGNGIVGTAIFDFSAASLDSGLAWDTSTFNVDGRVSVIPEPGTYALLSGLAALSFIMVRRRK